MNRVRNALAGFVVNYLLGYLLGRLVGDRTTGVRAGLAFGALGAVGSWVAAGRLADSGFDEDEAEPIEIEV